MLHASALHPACFGVMRVMSCKGEVGIECKYRRKGWTGHAVSRTLTGYKTYQHICWKQVHRACSMLHAFASHPVGRSCAMMVTSDELKGGI